MVVPAITASARQSAKAVKPATAPAATKLVPNPPTVIITPVRIVRELTTPVGLVTRAIKSPARPACLTATPWTATAPVRVMFTAIRQPKPEAAQLAKPEASPSTKPVW